jgi:signal transduction histidine kinase
VISSENGSNGCPIPHGCGTRRRQGSSGGDKRPPAPDVSRYAGAASGRARILVVEDDPSVRKSLVDILRDEGYGVETCENGAQALALAGASPPPDAIVLDLRMPVMDGWEFRLRQRSGDAVVSRIPVLAISADGSAKAAAIHADAYLRKPFSAEHLLAELERVLLDRKNQDLKGKLEHAQRLSAMGTVAAGIAHEIKNPLTVAVGSVQFASGVVARMVENVRSILAMAKAPPLVAACSSLQTEIGDLQGLLADAKGGLHAIGRIVQNVGSLARKSDDRRAPIDLTDTVELAIQLASHQIGRHARLVREHHDAPTVVGDRSRLAQVFLNLLINACQAMPKGAPEANEIKVKIDRRGADAVVQVVDTGPGIPGPLQQRIFEPFFTTKSAAEGTGLGLAICRDIVAEHGGSIELDSEPGKGTCFRVVLPLAREARS